MTYLIKALLCDLGSYNVIRAWEYGASSRRAVKAISVTIKQQEMMHYYSFPWMHRIAAMCLKYLEEGVFP